MRIFLDTNVLFDITAQRAPFAATANKLLIMGVFDDAELWVSAKSYTDLFYVMSKAHDSASIQRAFVAGLEHFKVCSVDGNDIRLAASREWPDFEDCLVSVCAEKVKADYLLTRDAEGFGRSTTPALSPEEFFAGLERTHGLVYEEVTLDEPASA